MSQPSHPTLINLPQPPSNPDTPSEMPGTPTSTTTSLSALSTTAIKDGHRGQAHHGHYYRGHQHNPSTTSLEAERADRISRLAGLSTVSTLRGPPAGFVPLQNQQYYNSNNPLDSPQTTPTSTTGFPHFPSNGNNNSNAMHNFIIAMGSGSGGPSGVGGIPGGLTPAYFDAAGQPVAATKMSTVGSASATTEDAGSVGGRSVGGRTTGTEERNDFVDEYVNRDDGNDRDSASGYIGMDDELMDGLATRSLGGFEDRMSDDGNASLVGFGEGAGSTVSGPIYHRRPLPGLQSSASAMASGVAWGLERSSSGLSEGGSALGGWRRDILRASERDNSGLSGGSAGGDTPVSQSAIQERREARLVDGVALDGATTSLVPADVDIFVDTTTRGPVPVIQPLQPNISAIRETQQPHSHQQQQQALAQAQAQAQARHLGSGLAATARPSTSTSMPASREAAERIIRERLDNGEARIGATALGSPRASEPLGRFYFEERK
ncbi:hypothetical protein B0T25DRAFT_552990 [Lasiosphaeria hispida]|uniref:Uncharacterized protein n=1 Tax=Lasiosphaeria hispida TaxID=260671 RepID=A0AAJ0HC23_9PEZI|nr:hypothetical protein B0T25DRAFT_552990 [Lasiosphaeria hispida]